MLSVEYHNLSETELKLNLLGITNSALLVLNCVSLLSPDEPFLILNTYHRGFNANQANQEFIQILHRNDQFLHNGLCICQFTKPLQSLGVFVTSSVLDSCWLEWLLWVGLGW